eukprot:TRINITY_DN111904_c0_g1_i1.p1 TRINITY_DN111904_c0_g1~~TRINITY_DN111904_c0_g1_i1.p1  ORF type:complete len:653 (+),score=170.54 TRINITY_DN111904_c0_g1_i1:79-2037(+)
MALSRKSPILLLLCSPGVPAPWVPIGDVSEVTPPGQQSSLPAVDADGAVVLHAHRLSLGPYNIEDNKGNLASLSHMPHHLKSARNHALVGDMELGTPGQRLSFMFDASGSDIWVPSKKCATCAENTAEQRGFYNANASKTFEPAMHETLFGMAPVASRVLYGGGSAAGFICRDTFKVGGVEVKDQVFLIAEEGGPDSRRSRRWDGVFGIGWQPPSEAGKPLYEKLPKAMPAGLQSMYAIAPTDKRGKYLMTVGKLPKGLDAKAIHWTTSATAAPWMVDASVNSKQAQVVMETGTSFLLVPHHTYLTFVRTIYPNFDRHCGVDKDAGNIVTCDCSLLKETIKPISITFSGDNTVFTIPAEDLVEQTTDSYGTVCVPQVQQRPADHEVTDPFGLLGAPLLDADEALDAMGPGGAFGLPLPPPFLGAPGPGGPLGQMIHSGGKDRGKYGPVPLPPAIAALNNLTQSLEKSLSKISDERNPTPKDVEHALEHALDGQKKFGAAKETIIEPGKNGAIKEVVVEELGDGTRCETTVMRDRNGKILSKHTEAKTPDGKKKSVHELVCSGTQVKDGPTAGRRLRGVMSDVWVLGDCFSRRHDLVLDFKNKRLGVAKSAVAPTGASSFDAEVESSQGTSDGVDALQTWDKKALDEVAEKFV